MATDVVGFAGLGAMGYQMARVMSIFLKSTGRKLLIWNRSTAKCHALAADPAVSVQVVDSLIELSKACDIIFTMLADDGAVRAVIGQLLASGGRASILVDCSTILPETTEDLAERASAVGAGYVAACVFGRPDAAAAARLIVIAAGAKETKQRVLPYLTALCIKYIDLGIAPHKANVMKLCGNFTIVSMIEMISETLTLAERNGVSKEVVLDFLSTFYPSPAIQGYSTRIAEDNFVAGQGFTVELGLKDVGHMRAMATSSSTPLPLADLAHQHLLQARAMGHGNSDWGAIAVAVRQNAGLPTPPPAPAHAPNVPVDSRGVPRSL